MKSSPHSDKPLKQAPVAVQAEPPLGPELCAELERCGFEVLPEGNVLTHALTKRAIVVCEVREQTEALAQQLLESARDRILIFVGPTGMPLAGSQRNVRELSADVSVAEIVRVCRLFAHEHPSDPLWAAPPTSQRAAPYNVLPRVSEGPASPMHSVQAPLLPSSVPPSSKPKPPPRVPSLPPALAEGGFVDDASSMLSSELSPGLSRILADAEQRVSSLAPRASTEAEGTNQAMPLSAELLAALEDPIGDYEPRATSGASSISNLSPGSTAAGLSPPSSRPAAPPNEDTGRHSPLPAPTSSQLPDAMASSISPHSQTAAMPLSDSDRPQHSSNRQPHTGTAPAPPLSEVPVTPIPPTSVPPRSLRPNSEPPSSVDLSTRPPATATMGQHDVPSALSPVPAQAEAPAPISSERITARPARRMSPIPKAPGLPTDSWAQRAASDGQRPEFDRSRAPEPRSAPPPPSFSPRAAAPTPLPPRLAERRFSSGPPPESDEDGRFPTEIPPLRPGDAVALVASAIRQRFTGSLAFEDAETIRRLVLKDGDLVTAASGSRQESLVAFLVREGTLSADVELQLGHKIPNFGRHAGAALIAAGHLPQSQLWPVLRAHAEFVITRVLQLRSGSAEYENDVPVRLQAEPAVFGGATGSEVFIELMRRALEPEDALRRLGGEDAELQQGPNFDLLDECALSADERRPLEDLHAGPIGSALAVSPTEEFPCVLFALSQLQVLRVVPRARKPSHERGAPKHDRLDDEAMRHAILARKALVDNGDYFALLGVSRDATSYDIRRAFLRLRRRFEPSEALTPATFDLRDDVEILIEVLTEAYEVLRDPLRRDRYRRAIESVPAAG